jgi:Fe(3+) dicitrate transport protein
MTATLLLLALLVQQADAPPGAPAAEDAPVAEPPATTETIVGARRDLRRVAGSAYTVDRETLERFEPDDVHRALRTAPGVYVRDEDGMGLRPNIGLRGASSDRSAKVALLEDGVLFAPSPYAAPAAYYFPLTTRMTGIEVFKGPAAIRQGPHTVGGAINLRTRPVPSAPAFGLDVGAGLIGPERAQSRLHAHGGIGDDQWGVLLEGARVQSDGFKRIDGAPDANTGFVRDDLMLKARVGTSMLEDVRHGFEMKLGYGAEDSNETYLGLTDADFRKDAFRRYAASQDDHMEWTRTQAQLRYTFAWDDDVTVDVVGYRHDLDRTWNKVNGVKDAPALHDVLAYGDVGAFPIYVDKLRGLNDTESDSTAQILIGPNQRTMYSHGLATVTRARLSLLAEPWTVEQRFELGARLHQDGVARLHTERAYLLRGGRLVAGDEPETVTGDNRADATAIAVHATDEVRFLDFTIVPGVRVEHIRGALKDDLPGGSTQDSEQLAVLPGLGAAWQPLPALVLLAGVHRGFSPVAPGQTGRVKPEQSTNAEAGARLDVRGAIGLSAELIGFFSLYENILGECTFSSGCINDIGTQQNGGQATIGGAESLVRHEVALPWRTSRLRTEASYTFTHTQFLTTFQSDHPLFGSVQAGDEMAYVPAHQAAVTSAVVFDALDVGVSVGLISRMRDVPGQGDAPDAELTDAQAVVDLAFGYQLFEGARLNLRVDNALDQRAIVSRRPFGARPGKPRSVLLSFEIAAP